MDKGKVRIHTHHGQRMQSNVYFIDDELKVQIDAGVPIERKPELLILTHCHFDHIRSIPECEIAASAKCADHLANLDPVVLADRSLEPVKPVKVTRVLKDGDIIDTGFFKFKVLETPGHTDGSICLYEEEHHILFSGDTVFELDDYGIRVFGRTDLPSSNPDALDKSIKRLERLKINTLYPGHG
jgi:glyoxylase-like metal-dependent hydrolase (beta-lactamase superfamily II)